MTESFQTGGVVTAAVSSPWWVPFMENLNVTLTTVLTTLGIVLTIIKIVQSTRKDKK